MKKNAKVWAIRHSNARESGHSYVREHLIESNWLEDYLVEHSGKAVTTKTKAIFSETTNTLTNEKFRGGRLYFS